MSFLNFSIHPEGWIFSGIAFAITLFLYWIDPVLGNVGAILTAWVLYFFRNPVRVPPAREGLVISAGDGIVVSIEKEVTPPAELGLKSGKTKWTRVGTFLNVFDVHINRTPFAGKIIKSVYHPGQFLNASFDKASDLNERHSILIENEDKFKVVCVQIAGLIARRIRCDLKEDEKVQAGSIYGLIRFGSRVDLYFPSEVEPLVSVGQRMIGGETVIADPTRLKKTITQK